jgi:hypothetical protein
MKKITGTYHNGKLTLDQPLDTQHPVRVTITVEEETTKALKLSDFSFLEAQELLKDCTTSFAEDLIEERRNRI